MSLSTETYARGRRVHTLAVCPRGDAFATNENRWKHLLEDHAREDFGLSPLGEVAEGHAALLGPRREARGARQSADDSRTCGGIEHAHEQRNYDIRATVETKELRDSDAIF